VDRDYLDAAVLGSDLEAGSYLFLAVEDAGSGMDPVALKRIFEPFFTTRTNHRGLGMAALLGIVRGHHGGIHIESRLGRGTTVRVLLPVSDKPAVPQPQVPQLQIAEPRRPAVDASQESKRKRAPDTWQGSGTVLVVDDEESVRQVARSVVERAGFKTLSAVDGPSAIEIFRENKAEIVAVLVDISMPELDGIETAQEIRRIRRNIVIILTSGYSEQVTKIRHSGLDPDMNFLQKPYRPRQLMMKLRELL
jgi:two-component system cell cycle sensor histidine kinase/response regulator CckA